MYSYIQHFLNLSYIKKNTHDLWGEVHWPHPLYVRVMSSDPEKEWT